MTGKHIIIMLPLALLALGGCARIAPQVAFEPVAVEVSDRIRKQVHWDSGGSDDLAARAAVKGLLSRPLTPAAAVQVALLNNRELQAAYGEIGIAQANLVQAGLLKNPVFDGAVTWFADAGGTPNLAFGAAWSFVDLLKRPRRKAVARSELEATQLRVARGVIVHAADTHAAFVDYVAAVQEVDLLKGVTESVEAAVKTAAALRKAGNITELQFEQHQSFLTTAKLEQARTEARADEAREALNVLMGLTGGQTYWSAAHKLPAPPAAVHGGADLERRSVEASLDIALARQKLTTLGRRFRLTRKDSLLPDAEAGAEYEREVEVERDDESGAKEKTLRRAWGPTFEVEIPIFDHGQARKAGVLLQIQQAENELWAVAVRVRSAARLAKARVETAARTHGYYQQAVLPQSERLLKGTQRDYNAMQASIFQLIEARRQQIQAERQAIQARRVWWISHVRLEQLLSGALPEGADTGAVEVASAGGGGDDEAGGH